MKRSPFLILLALLTLAEPLAAAEIVLRREAHSSRTVVTLADVAEIVTADESVAKRLAAFELGPSPATGRRGRLRVREIQDALTRAGENLLEHRFTGASEVDLLGPQVERAPPRTAPAPIVPTRQVEAEVSVAQHYVVTRRAMTRGTVLGAGDLELAVPPTKSLRRGQSPFLSVDEVLGNELTETVPAGAVLSSANIRAPLLVHRGQAVTVYSRAAGIEVRTTARAKEDGSHGTLVAVETIEDRQSYLARVCGSQEVEVLAGAASAPQRDRKPLPVEPVAVAATTVSQTLPIPEPPAKPAGRSRFLTQASAGDSSAPRDERTADTPGHANRGWRSRSRPQPTGDSR